MTVDEVGPDGVEEALATVADVRRASVAAGEPDPLDEATARRLRRPGAARLWVARGPDGGGFAALHDGALDLAVAPASRGRGLGAALAAEATADGEVTSAWSHADHPAARTLAARLGLEPARALWVLRRPTSLPLPALVVPDGVTIRGYRDHDDTDRDELLRVNAAAFAHHPEQGAMDADDLAARMAESWYDAADLLLATGDRTGRLLGFHWTKRHSPTVGEVYVVGVDPAAQGRGLGHVVTLAGLHHLADVLTPDGEVHLYVEADNVVARRLYEDLGFTHAAHDTHVQYRRA